MGAQVPEARSRYGFRVGIRRERRPLFCRAPACMRARPKATRRGHDGTASRINRSGELWESGQACRGAGGACRSGAWRRKPSNQWARTYCDSIRGIGYSHVLSISMDTCPLRMQLPVLGPCSPPSVYRSIQPVLFAGPVCATAAPEGAADTCIGCMNRRTRRPCRSRERPSSVCRALRSRYGVEVPECTCRFLPDRMPWAAGPRNSARRTAERCDEIHRIFVHASCPLRSVHGDRLCRGVRLG